MITASEAALLDKQTDTNEMAKYIVEEFAKDLDAADSAVKWAIAHGQERAVLALWGRRKSQIEILRAEVCGLGYTVQFDLRDPVVHDWTISISWGI